MGMERGDSSAFRVSRYVRGVWEMPEPEGADRFRAAFLEHFPGMTRDRMAILPVGDRELRTVNEARAMLEPFATILGVEAGLMALCQDKAALNALAQEVGLRVPASAVSGKADIGRMADALGATRFIVKAADPDAELGRKAILLDSRAELDACVEALAADPRVTGRFMIQERVFGQRINCRFVARSGKLIAYQQQVVLRTDTSDGTGFGVAGVTQESDGLRADLAALVERIGYHGVGLAQFIVRQGERPAFLELNPRLDGSCAVAVASGLDLPGLMCQVHGEDAFHSGTPSIPSWTGFRVLRYHWMLGDLNGGLAAIRQQQLGAAASFRWIGRCLLDGLRADVHLTFCWRDPWPTLVLFGERLLRRWRYVD
ncbi:MAG: hypothetical protein RLZZ200_361 [Pseudomonadota bacterium]